MFSPLYLTVQNRGPTRAGLLLQIEITATIPSLLWICGRESIAALKINDVLVSNVWMKITLLEGDGVYYFMSAFLQWLTYLYSTSTQKIREHSSLKKKAKY